MAADVLVAQGARASAAMTWTYMSRKILVLAPERSLYFHMGPRLLMSIIFNPSMDK